MRTRPLPPHVIPSNTPAHVDDRWYFPFTWITSSTINAEEATNGKYAGYVGSVTSTMNRHVFEIGSLHPIILPDPTGVPIAYGRWLVACMATQDGSGAFSSAVANAQVSAKKNQLMTESRGLSSVASRGFHDLAGTELDVNSVKTFGEAIGRAVRWCVDHAETVDGTADPGGSHCLLAVNPRPLISTCWALNSIAAGWSAESAMAIPGLDWKKARRPPAEVDGVTVAAIYHRLGVDPAKKPTSAQRTLASQIKSGTAEMPLENKKVASWMLDVPPFLREDLAVCALERFSTIAARIKVSAWPPQDLSAPRDVTFNTEVSASAVVSASAAGLVDGSTDSDARYWRWGYLSEATRDGFEGSLILTERYASGFQAFVRFISADSDVSAQVIAAKATLKAVSTSMEVHITGVDVGKLENLSSFCAAAINGFDVSTVQALGAISADVASVLEDGAGFAPCLTGVALDLSASELQGLAAHAAEYCEGLRSIVARVPRKIATFKDEVLREHVAFVYDQLQVADRPTAKQSARALEILEIGA